MPGLPRMTHATALVLQALDQGHRHGFDIVEATRLRGGTVYPVLRRLEERGLVESRWEDAEVGRREGRPSRKYFRLVSAARDALREARERYPLPAVSSSGRHPARLRTGEAP